jgi:hypothetical protein
MSEMKRITDGMDAKNFEGLNKKQIILQRLKLDLA